MCIMNLAVNNYPNTHNKDMKRFIDNSFFVGFGDVSGLLSDHLIKGQEVSRRYIRAILLNATLIAISLGLTWRVVLM